MILSNQSPAAFPLRLRLILAAIGMLAISLSGLQTHLNAPALGAAVQTPALVNSFSAASYGTLLTPEGIAAAFGASLAPGTARATTLPLPTVLNGVSLTVGGRAAGLFFVSVGQINYLVPPETAPGEAEVVVRANNIVTHMGRISIANAAPALFTFSGNGLGVPAATALRVSGATQRVESIVQNDAGVFVPRPLNLGPVGEKVFLILSLAGIRRLPNSDANGGNGAAENVRVLLGGLELTPAFAGAAPGFAGLDQINLELPRTLIGRGRIKLAVLAGGLASNEVEIEIAPAAASGRSPIVTSFAPSTITAGEALTIQGGNFGTLTPENTALIGGNESRTFDAVAPNQLIVRVPYGAESGTVAVRTAQGEGAGPGRISVLTSASGFVEDTKQPANRIPGVKIKISTVSATSNNEGAFLLRNPPVSDAQLIEIDPTELPLTPKLDRLIVKQPVRGARDNHFGPIPLQAIIGPGILLGGGAGFQSSAGCPACVLARMSPIAGATQAGQPALLLAPAASITTGGVTLEVADNVSATFPNGATRGVVYLSVIENSRTPVELPPGVFSATIAQLSPFGVKLDPGGKLTFPNPDRLPANSAARLYKFDQTPGSRTIGEFVDVGAAIVSADGQRVETGPNAITETSIYFAARPSPVTTVLGRVVDSDGLTPVRRVFVYTRGQQTFSDGSGGFVLRDVPVGADNLLNIEASYERPNGRVDRVRRSGVVAVVNGLTRVTPDLVLPAPVPNRPPTLIAPPTLSSNEGETANIGFLASDPDPQQTVQIAVSGAPFASLVGNNVLRLAPGANTAGDYVLRLTVTDNLGLSTAQIIALTIVRPNRAPVASNQSLTVAEDNALALTLNVADPDNDPLTYTIVTPPQRGVLTGTGAARSYLPARDFNGADSFAFRANDGELASNTATVTLNVTPVNDAPVLSVPGAQLSTAGQNLTFTISATDVDAGQTLNLFATDLPAGATFTAATRRFAWTPGFNQAGTYLVSFNVTDNGSPQLGDTKTVAITVAQGQGWAQTNGPYGGRIFALLASGGNLFAGTSGGGVFRSTDGGNSWTAVNNGLGRQDVRSLAVSGTTVFAGTGGNGVYRTTDNGANWTQVNNGLGNQQVLSLAVSGATVFAGTVGNGVYRTTDNGANWMQVNNGPGNQRVFALAVSGATVFAGTLDNGVFRTTDNGANWTPFNEGLTSLRVYSLAVSGNNLFAGTVDSSVFVRPLP